MRVDAQVVRGADRERARLDDLYVRHVSAAGGLAYLLTGNRDLAEDLVHEAFARLAGRFRDVVNPDAFEAYLRRTIVNLHLSRLRRLKVERAYVTTLGQQIAAHSVMQDVAAREDLWAALLRLPKRQRAAIVLRYYEDLSERETAEMLHCSLAAARSLVGRGVRTLRRELGDERL